MSGQHPQSPETIFRAHGGQMRMSEALEAGLSRYQLYRLRDAGVIEAISRVDNVMRPYLEAGL